MDKSQKEDAQQFVNKLVKEFEKIDKEIMKEKIDGFVDKWHQCPLEVGRDIFKSDLVGLIKDASKKA